MSTADQNFKNIIVHLSANGWTTDHISSHLLEVHQVQFSRQSISKFLSYYRRPSSLLQKSGSGRMTKVIPEVKHMVEAKVQADNETTATQLHQVLQQSGINISLMTVKQRRRDLWWTFHALQRRIGLLNWNPNPNMFLKCMCGLVSVKGEQPEYTYLKERWTLTCIWRLLSSIQSQFPSTHRFMQDNHPKHTSRKVTEFFDSQKSIGGTHPCNRQT